MFQAQRPVVYWFRRDLRLADNEGLCDAATAGPVVPVFIWAPDEEGGWQPGAAARWWLHSSLEALGRSLARLGAPLVIASGRSSTELLRIARETDAQAVYWERRYEPAASARDADVERAVRAEGLATRVFAGALLTDPDVVRTQGGRPFRVFTPFWRRALATLNAGAAVAAPDALSPAAKPAASLEVADLGLIPRVDWATGFRERWRPGEEGAAIALRALLPERVRGYPVDRDFPALEGTSRLSPHFHFGEISVAAVWRALVTLRTRVDEAARDSIDAYLRQLGWRDFAYHVLVHFPHTPVAALDAGMEWFPWTKDLSVLPAWQRGLTGYPIVDAGMRELWATGWMHNRVRMIVASFLVKDLLVDWRHGARWFWDTLVDADLASNTLGWQWAAGCGADAAPYFRIFNPLLQGHKFDPAGDYVRRWVPELAKLDTKWIQSPWEAPPDALARAGIELGRSYPRPIVDHAAARLRALAALRQLKAHSTTARAQPGIEQGVFDD